MHSKDKGKRNLGWWRVMTCRPVMTGHVVNKDGAGNKGGVVIAKHGHDSSLRAAAGKEWIHRLQPPFAR